MARRLLLALVLISAVALAACFLFCGGKQRGPKPNVLVLLIDTLRADHLSYAGYERNTSPTLDNFAKENVNFSYAVSPSCWTPPSVASLFSGMYPSVHGHMPLKEGKGSTFTKLDDSFETIAEALKNNGYDTAAISANPLINEKFGLHQGFNLFVSPGREPAEKVTARALKYLGDMRPKESPFFLYLHYMDPHFTYDPPKEYEEMFTGPISLSGRFKGRNYRKREIRFMGKYDGEIRYTDDKIGELFAWMKNNQLYDNTVIFVIADHGEQFMERGHLGHADRLFSEETRVPFLLKADGLKKEITTPVSLIDVFPTIMELTGIDKQHEMHGYSLTSDLHSREQEGVYTEVVRHFNQKAFIRSDGKKLLAQYEMEKGLILNPAENIMFEKVFDTNTDYAEVEPLQDEALKQALQKQFYELYGKKLKLRSQYSQGETATDQETLEQLKSLGYL